MSNIYLFGNGLSQGRRLSKFWGGSGAGQVALQWGPCCMLDSSEGTAW